MVKPKILIGMSGGVDSSVSAALLVEQGHEVEGVFLKVWSEDDVASSVDRRSYVVDRGYNPPATIALPPPAGSQSHPAGDPGAVRDFTTCPWEEDLADARAVAAQLGIKLHVLNVQREYFARVVQEMKAGYARGEVPNPDVLCNSEIKFGILYEWAMEQGFDYVATGHYARTSGKVKGKSQKTKLKSKTKSVELHTAEDRLKDQTYFLWRVPRERFAHILFPIGHLQKSEVRRIAADCRLPIADKPDSQGICFLGHVNVRSWLKRELKTIPGPVVNRAGQIVGRHEGTALYTIGQRHGLGIFGGGPVYYVVEKDIALNTLVVDERLAAGRETLTVGETNWLVDDPLSYPAIEARIRHQGDRIACAIRRTANSEQQTAKAQAQSSVHRSPFTVHLSSPAFGVAPGQSVVLYNGETVLGGGIIRE